MAGSNIRILRGETYRRVDDLLLKAERAATRIKAGSWRRNRSRWTDDMRLVYENRNKAMKLVAGELAKQVNGWQGLGLVSKSRYEPWRTDFKDSVGGYSFTNRLIRMGENAFESPSSLVHTMMHESYHRWQHLNLNPSVLRITAAVEADAHLFSLENRRRTGASLESLRHSYGWFKKYLDVSDRLSKGLPVKEKDRKKYHITRPIKPAMLTALNRRFSLLEPALLREMIIPNYSSVWSGKLHPFIFQPWKKTGVYDAVPFFRKKMTVSPFSVPRAATGNTFKGSFIKTERPINISPFVPSTRKFKYNPFFKTSTISGSGPGALSPMAPGTTYSNIYNRTSYRVDNFGRSVPTGTLPLGSKLNTLTGPSLGRGLPKAYNSPMAPGTIYSNIYNRTSYRVDNFGRSIPTGTLPLRNRYNQFTGPSWRTGQYKAYNSPMAPGTTYSNINTGLSYRVNNFGRHTPTGHVFGWKLR